MKNGQLTEVSTEVEGLSARTPLVSVDGSIWLHVNPELLITACELVQSAVLVVFNVIPQLLETAVPVISTT